MPDQEKKRKWTDRLQDRFLLTVRNEDTFEEKYRFHLSLFQVYSTLIGLFLFVGILFMSILIATPLKRLIPGYGVIEDQTAFIELKSNLKRLEEEVKVKDTYIHSIQKMLTNDVETVQEAMAKEQPASSHQENIKRIKEDEIIRNSFENKIDINKANTSTSTAKKASDKKGTLLYFIPPVAGQISARFMPKNEHYGVDITAPKNTPIQAVLDGYIINADWTIKTGHTIGIQHDNNMISFYKHNSLLLKSVGEHVKSGEAIAIIGNSGTLTDGPHLHFELWKNGRPIDPQSYIQFNH